MQSPKYKAKSVAFDYSYIGIDRISNYTRSNLDLPQNPSNSVVYTRPLLHKTGTILSNFRRKSIVHSREIIHI